MNLYGAEPDMEYKVHLPAWDVCEGEDAIEELDELTDAITEEDEV